MVILKLLTMVVGGEVEDDMVCDNGPPSDARLLSSSTELPTDLLSVHQDVLPAAKTLTKGQWLSAWKHQSRRFLVLLSQTKQNCNYCEGCFAATRLRF